MANSLKRISFELTGFDELAKGLRELPAKTEAKVIGNALEYAVKPVVRRAKALVAHRTGALRRSITHVLRQYAGKAVVIFGPDRDYYEGGKRVKKGAKGKDRPAKYAHLVEFGHKTRASGRGGFRKFTTKERESANEVGRALPQSGTRKVEYVSPKPFLRPAVEQGKAEAAATFAVAIQKGLEKEIMVMHRKNKRIRAKIRSTS